jgi:type VI secretion system secreted protein VgrG
MAQGMLSVRLESTQLAGKPVQVIQVDGNEAISRLFRFDVRLVLTGGDALSTDAVIGAPASLVFEQDGQPTRTVYGMVAEVEDLLEGDSNLHTYRLVLVPRAHRLTLVETQEVFVNVAVPAIVQQKLKLVGLGAADIAMLLRSEYPARELTVEYKETDLAFVSRQTENAGISFFFVHRDNHDAIVFTDHMAGFLSLPDCASVRFRPKGEARGVVSIQSIQRVSPKRYFVYDYNTKSPKTDLSGTYTAPTGLGGGVVEYGANVQSPAEATVLAQIRAEEREAAARYFRGESAVLAFTAGLRFQLLGHEQLGEKALLLVEVDHHFAQPVRLPSGGESPASYWNVFRATAADKVYRPPRVTPRPRILGLEIGVIEPGVFAQASKDVGTDAYGRYPVRFLFDISPRNAEKPPAPVRRVDPSVVAGDRTPCPLQSGTEVAVVFVGGDPDRPLIHGVVTNPSPSSPGTPGDAPPSPIEPPSGATRPPKDTEVPRG